MGLAHQPWNTVTFSYRQERFGRIKERNAKRIEDCVGAGKIKALFNSNPVEFKQVSVVFDVKGNLQEIPNDFLKKIGVGFGTGDITLEASTESRQADREKRQLLEASV